jgi:signal transduction histidine kinase
MKAPTTFWLRIFWSIVPIVTACLVVNGVISVREHRRVVTAEFMKRGEAVVSHLASSSELGVFTEDKQLLGASIRGVVKDPDVAYVVIHGESGQPLADGGRQISGVAGRIDAAVMQRPSSRSVAHGDERFIEFLAPVISEEAKTADEFLIGTLGDAKGQSRQARVIGGVRLGLALRGVEEHATGLIKWWGGVTVAFVIFSALAVYGFSRRITRPINRLTAQAQKIADGFLDQKIPVESRDEIGQLAVAFNEMTRALKGNIDDKEHVLAELQELNRTLEDRIQQRTVELQQASRHKSDFLANVSHELRTPMNAILGFNEMILAEVYGELPADLKVPLTDIQNSGKHLLRLINNVLDLSKIEAGRMELALGNYSVQDIVESVRASLRSLAADKGLEFVATVPDDIPLAYGDGGRITQCLLNLAGNALKFTRHGRVAISVALHDDHLVYRVEDTGIGIAPDKIESIFAEFRQGDASITSEFGGTGLGLSITKKFVEMHRGRIWVESELGKGSTFFFAIPLRLDRGTTG